MLHKHLQAKLTSSVKIAWPVLAPEVEPYIVADIWVVEGLSFKPGQQDDVPRYGEPVNKDIL
jgi:hypothetical protein